MLSLLGEKPDHKTKAYIPSQRRPSFDSADLNLGCELEYQCFLMDGSANEASSNFMDPLEELSSPKNPMWWCGRRAQPHRCCAGDTARHAILTWRLQRPYLAYCICCSFATLVLLLWNLYKGIQNKWNLPQWKHHRWEEVLEVALGACMVLETLLTLRVLGVKPFFRDTWCIFDFVVMLATVVSISYGLIHIGRKGEITEADVPLLCLRFVLQPARVLAVCMAARRTRRMQQADELQVDFNALESAGMSSGAISIQEMR